MQILNIGSGAIEKMCSKEQSRYTIADVYFDAEKGRLCATNGHAMVVAHAIVEKGECGGMIPAAALAAWWRIASKCQWNPRMCGIFCYKDEVVVEGVGHPSQSFPRPIVSQTFPNYEAVLPRFEQLAGPPAIVFDINLLVDLVSAIGLADRSHQVAIWPNPDPSGGGAIIKTSAQGAIGVLMPIRDSGGWVTSIEAMDQLVKEAIAPPKKVNNVTAMPSREEEADAVAEATTPEESHDDRTEAARSA